MRYFAFIYVLVLFFNPGRDSEKYLISGIQSMHVYWKSHQFAIQLSKNENWVELFENSDFDGPNAITTDLQFNNYRNLGKAEKVLTPVPKEFLNTVPYSLIDLPPSFVS